MPADPQPEGGEMSFFSSHQPPSDLAEAERRRPGAGATLLHLTGLRAWPGGSRAQGRSPAGAARPPYQPIPWAAGEGPGQAGKGVTSSPTPPLGTAQFLGPACRDTGQQVGNRSPGAGAHHWLTGPLLLSGGNPEVPRSRWARSCSLPTPPFGFTFLNTISFFFFCIFSI